MMKKCYIIHLRKLSGGIQSKQSVIGCETNLDEKIDLLERNFRCDLPNLEPYRFDRDLDNNTVKLAQFGKGNCENNICFRHQSRWACQSSFCQGMLLNYSYIF